MIFFTEHPLFSTATEALGITILHSLWQGFLLLFLLAFFFRFGKAKQPSTRFAVAFATLLIFLAAFGGTFYQQWVNLAPTLITTPPTEFAAEAVSVNSNSFAQTALEPTTIVESNRDWETGLTRLTQRAPWLAWLWIAGSFIFGLRLVNGLVQTQRLRYRIQPIPADWQQRVKKLSQRLGINQAVLYASTDRSSTPLTLGWVKPIILIPTSLLTMMPADQLESIFIHELAHIKRRDYLWNLIQSVAEVILFYHPAYWYISSVLERERELACDKLTITVTQRPRVYAQALLQVATQSTHAPLQSVAASGKRGLSDRIQHIIYPGRKQRGISVFPFIMLLSVISLSLAAFSWYQPISSNSENDLRHPDFIGYGQRYSFAATLPSELASYSREDYLIGQKDFAQKIPNPWKYFRKSTVYLLNGKIVDTSDSIRMDAIRRYEVYYAPLPPSLQNLDDKNYSAVVRAFTKDHPVAEKPFVVIGQITTRDGRRYKPVANVKIEVKESGQQTFTDASGSFQLPATPEGSLIVHWPDKNPEEIAIEGREYHSWITYSSKNRLEKYRDELQQRLVQRMSDTALAKDQKLIQQEINKLDKAINWLQENDSTLTKAIRGRATDAFANKGIEGMLVESSDGTVAITDEKGYYKIYLPTHITDTEFKFTHSDYDTQQIEVDATEQKAVYLSLLKEENQLTIQGQRIGSLNPDSSVTRRNNQAVLEDYEFVGRATSKEAEQPKEYDIKKDLYVIDGIPQQDRNNLSDIQPEDIVSVETVRVTSNRADQFEGLPVEGKDQVVFVTTKAALPLRTIKGRIIEDRSRDGIAGVRIRAGNGSTAVTDSEGYYQIQLPEDAQKTTFEFTHPDYPHGEIEAKITGEKLNDILFIKPEHYQKKKDSIAHLMEAKPVDLSQIQSLNAAGQSPLYIIDGVFVEGPLEDLDHNNVRYIEVVKSLEAEKRYGEEAVGGAVLITTKNPQSSRIIQGKVTNKKTGEPLPGINIIVEGTNTGTVTNPQGTYSIKVNNASARLAFKFLGYRDETHDVGEQSRVDVELNKLSPEETEIQRTKMAQQRATNLVKLNGKNSIKVPTRTDQELAQMLGFFDSLRIARGSNAFRSLTSSPTLFVAGHVIDHKTGNPLPGVNVTAEGGTTTVTDQRGCYHLTFSERPKTGKMSFTLPGYQAREIEAFNYHDYVGVALLEKKEKSYSPSYQSIPIEKSLFVVDGQIRKDVRSFDDIETLNLNVKSTQTFKGDDRWMSIPIEYRKQGYTKLVRIFTDDFKEHLVGRTVQGKLVNTGSGEPLVGAKISGLRNGERITLTRTDEHGEYKVTLPEDVEKVEYSYPGYSSIVLLDRRLLQSIPMAWTLHLKKEELPDKAPTFNNKLFVSPNPGNDEVNVRFALEKPGGVKFELLDKEGNMLYSEKHRYLDAGSKEVAIPTARFPANMYLLRVTVDNFSITRRIILN